MKFRFRVYVSVKDCIGEVYFMLFDWIVVEVIFENVVVLFNGLFDEVIICILYINYIFIIEKLVYN